MNPLDLFQAMPEREDSSSVLSLVGRHAMRLDTNPVMTSLSVLGDGDDEPTAQNPSAGASGPYTLSQSCSNPFAPRDPNARVDTLFPAKSMTSHQTNVAPKTIFSSHGAVVPTQESETSQHPPAEEGWPGMPPAWRGSSTSPCPRAAIRICSEDVPVFSPLSSFASMGGEKSAGDSGSGLLFSYRSAPVEDEGTMMRMPPLPRSPTVSPQPAPHPANEALAVRRSPARYPTMSAGEAGSPPPQAVCPVPHTENPDDPAPTTASTSFVRSQSVGRAQRQRAGDSGSRLYSELSGMTTEDQKETKAEEESTHFSSVERPSHTSPEVPHHRLVEQGSTVLVSSAVTLKPSNSGKPRREREEAGDDATPQREPSESRDSSNVSASSFIHASHHSSRGAVQGRGAELLPPCGVDAVDSSSSTSCGSSASRSGAPAREETVSDSLPDASEPDHSVLPPLSPSDGTHTDEQAHRSIDSPECRPPYDRLFSRAANVSPAVSRCYTEEVKALPVMSPTATPQPHAVEEEEVGSPLVILPTTEEASELRNTRSSRDDGVEEKAMEEGSSLRSTLSVSRLPPELSEEFSTTLLEHQSLAFPLLHHPLLTNRPFLNEESEPQSVAFRERRPTRHARSSSLLRDDADSPKASGSHHPVVFPTSDSPSCDRISVEVQDLVSRAQEKVRRTRESLLATLHSTREQFLSNAELRASEEAQETMEECRTQTDRLLVTSATPISHRQEGVAEKDISTTDGLFTPRNDIQTSTVMNSPTAVWRSSDTLRAALPLVGPILRTRLAGYDSHSIGYVPMETLMRVVEQVLEQRGGSYALGRTNGSVEGLSNTTALSATPGGYTPAAPTPTMVRYQRLEVHQTTASDPPPQPHATRLVPFTASLSTTAATPALRSAGRQAVNWSGGRKRRAENSPLPAVACPLFLPHPDEAEDDVAEASPPLKITRRSPTRTLERITQQQQHQQEQLQLTEHMIGLVSLFQEEFGRRYAWQHFGATNVSRHDPHITEALAAWKQSKSSATAENTGKDDHRENVTQRSLSFYFPRLRQMYAPSSSLDSGAVQCPPLDVLVDYDRFVRSLEKMRQPAEGSELTCSSSGSPSLVMITATE